MLRAGPEHANEQTDALEKSAAPKTQPTFRPVDLDAFPEVDALLIQLGLGALVRDSVSAPVGRNHAWAGNTKSGRRVFVKRLVGPEADVRARMKRLLSFEEFVRDVDGLAGYVPSLLGFDEDARLVVFAHIEAKSGAELMVDQTFGGDLAFAVGRAIGSLHAAVPDGELDQTLPSLPDAGLLRGMPLAMYNELSFAELEAWRLMQHDPALIKALEDLQEWESQAPRVPSHCDFRVDQLLVADDGVPILTDWEEFRLSDPARDVGSFAGEWLYRSVLDIVTNRGDARSSAFDDLELTHDQVLARGTEKMERLLPLVHRFWSGYRTVRTHLDPGFTARATAFAGWHLLDRLIAGAAQSQRLSGIERAAAGIGRGALLTPHKFAPLLGFEVTT
ncbi:class V lanthionine synthetase subunit LxmK [Streptomyces lunaelactis]|uniref:class V lanthionine synthetase subunit LxmK n=1 Tax=Streptomyces lunaelactis TaxID=1535768 RepID=UPI00158495CB|nr:class V lanthionine synthetase subunit LxmK [Streptomyces lunaelactis]NUK59707.1 phosphotransferase [Streptomyces lunaelactis]